MSKESRIKKAIKKLKERFPEIREEEIERELIPLQKNIGKPKLVKKKKSE